VQHKIVSVVAQTAQYDSTLKGIRQAVREGWTASTETVVVTYLRLQAFAQLAAVSMGLIYWLASFVAVWIAGLHGHLVTCVMAFG
jgi:hypothetical protein